VDPVLAGLIGTVIGGLFGIAGGVLTGRRQAILERERWLQTRDDDIAKETRLALAELTRKMGAAIQTMMWLAGKAASNPARLTQQDISDYDKEIAGLLPDILGSLMVVSALDNELSDKMAPLVGEIYGADGELASAAQSFEDSREASTAAIAALYNPRVSGLYDDLSEKIGDITVVASVGRKLAEST
jgi:hypothetical protein